MGAGAVGLAAAARLAARGLKVAVIERHRAPAQETSGRNSGVLHTGIHDPPGSLKSSLCVRGRRLLYEFCERHGVACRRTGKLVVAAGTGDFAALEAMKARGEAAGAERLELLDRAGLKAHEPRVEGAAALWCPESGVVDAPALARALARLCRDRGASLLYDAELVAVRRGPSGYELTLRRLADLVRARVVVNAAGLWAHEVAAMAGVDPFKAGYVPRLCKGEYFRIRRPLGVMRLVYPLPGTAGLGIHLTVGANGVQRLGPNAFFVGSIDYGVDPSHRGEFHRQARVFLPGLKPEDLEPDMAGVRPKLSGEGGAFRDFVVAHEAGRGLPGLVTLAGIESPGLTACLAIAERVEALAAEAL